VFRVDGYMGVASPAWLGWLYCCDQFWDVVVFTGNMVLRCGMAGVWAMGYVLSAGVVFVCRCVIGTVFVYLTSSVAYWLVWVYVFLCWCCFCWKCLWFIGVCCRVSCFVVGVLWLPFGLFCC
jgi:hypothetical protein